MNYVVAYFPRVLVFRKIGAERSFAKQKRIPSSEHLMRQPEGATMIAADR